MAPWTRRYGALAWIVFTPLITVPLTQALVAPLVRSSSCIYRLDFFGGEASCPDGRVLLTLLPGLINLVPIAWLWVKDDEARRSAIAGSIVGAARLAVPVIGVLVSGPGVGCPYDLIACQNPSGYTVLIWGWTSAFPNSDSLLVIATSALLWLLSLVLWIWFGVRGWRHRRAEAKEKGPRPSPEPLE